MKKKMSSQELNDILLSTQNKINEMNEGINKTKKDANKKLLINKYETEYMLNKMSNLQFRQQEDGDFLILTDAFKGLYTSYCNVVHPYFKKEPINIFNLRAINNPIPYFRNEVVVKINGVENDYYKNILKASDVKDKEIFFEEYPDKNELIDATADTDAEVVDKNNLEISIEVDKDKAIGISKFNMIEIDSYLLGSFDINKIDIYGDEEIPVLTLPAINNAGKTRIILDKKYIFKKVVLNITPKYKTQEDVKVIVPFGLKHIFFYEADFRSDSYLILKYTSDKFIDNIKNDLTVLSPFGFKNTTIKEEGIEIYLDNNNGTLENKHEPSENIKNPIARNLKTIYFRIPLGDKLNKENNYINSFIACKFFIEKR